MTHGSPQLMDMSLADQITNISLKRLKNEDCNIMYVSYESHDSTLELQSAALLHNFS